MGLWAVDLPEPESWAHPAHTKPRQFLLFVSGPRASLCLVPGPALRGVQSPHSPCAMGIRAQGLHGPAHQGHELAVTPSAVCLSVHVSVSICRRAPLFASC